MIVDMQFVIFSGILVGIFFVLNYATCYSMPWSKCIAPHECPGKKKCPEHMKRMLCNYHKQIAWLTVITGVFHVIVSVLYFL